MPVRIWKLSSMELDSMEICASAQKQWNDDLGRIIVEGVQRNQKTVFYTALYHTLIHPEYPPGCKWEYPAMKSEKRRRLKTIIHIYSLWDTYRNLHQLMTLVYPRRQIDMVHYHDR